VLDSRKTNCPVFLVVPRVRRGQRQGQTPVQVAMLASIGDAVGAPAALVLPKKCPSSSAVDSTSPQDPLLPPFFPPFPPLPPPSPTFPPAPLVACRRPLFPTEAWSSIPREYLYRL
jgi:hypothetical protein